MNEHLGADILITDADVSVVPTGDVDVVRGLRCLLQDMVLRLATPRGDHWMHPDYGLDIQRFLHVEATPVNLLDFRHAVEAEVEKDPRVESASCEVRSWDLESVVFRLEVKPIGSTTALNLVLGYDLANLTLEVVRGA